MADFFKQPAEQFWVSADFSSVMTEGDSINLLSSSVLCYDKNGNLLDNNSSLIDPAAALSLVGNSEMTVRVMGGDPALSPYKLSFRAWTLTGDVYEFDQYFNVEEL